MSSYIEKADQGVLAQTVLKMSASLVARRAATSKAKAGVTIAWRGTRQNKQAEQGA
jgi:hypothetical protein